MTTTEPNKVRFGAKAALITIAIVSYPLVAHLSVLWDQRLVGIGWALVIGASVLWSMRRRGPGVILALFGLLAVTVAALALSRIEDLVYLPPIAINLILMGVFGRTLRQGRTPLASAFASMARGTLHPRVALYTRRVTQTWTVFFALMTVELIVLAAFASAEIWSLFANGLNYLFTVLMFVAEYGVRRYRLADFEHPGPVQYLRFLKQTDLRSALEWRPGVDGTDETDGPGVGAA